jgi:hypothetical protein
MIRESERHFYFASLQSGVPPAAGSVRSERDASPAGKKKKKSP